MIKDKTKHLPMLNIYVVNFFRIVKLHASASIYTDYIEFKSGGFDMR